MNENLDTTILFFFKDTATTEIYTYLHTLSLHDALPIFLHAVGNCGIAGQGEDDREISRPRFQGFGKLWSCARSAAQGRVGRSEEHTSELQSLMRISYAVFC